MLLSFVHKVAGVVVSPSQPQLWSQKVVSLKGPQLEVVGPLLCQPLFGPHQCRLVRLREELVTGKVVLNDLHQSHMRLTHHSSFGCTDTWFILEGSQSVALLLRDCIEPAVRFADTSASCCTCMSRGNQQRKSMLGNRQHFQQCVWFPNPKFAVASQCQHCDQKGAEAELAVMNTVMVVCRTCSCTPAKKLAHWTQDWRKPAGRALKGSMALFAYTSSLT